ncbi:MAG TPA: energy transducer TonB [Candidatus Cloacimonadota bacterium]|nr:energy transducer TonB [Candidatus Cloacimonadota bacterium]
MNRIIKLSILAMLVILMNIGLSGCSGNFAQKPQIEDSPSTTASSPSQLDETPVEFVPFEDPPLPIGSINPVYPEFARKNGIQGTVVLEVEVLKDGSVRNIHVKRSVSGGLDEAAIEAVRKVRFKPGRSSGQPVDVLLIMPVEFTLH